MTTGSAPLVTSTLGAPASDPPVGKCKPPQVRVHCAGNRPLPRDPATYSKQPLRANHLHGGVLRLHLVPF
jgi:hypothetical protein